MVSFLAEPRPTERVAAIDPEGFAPDRFEFGDLAIYLYMPYGYRDSQLPNFERHLGVAATTRTWRTATRLRDLSAA
jgi:uncharacterized protein (DUF1697 family)